MADIQLEECPDNPGKGHCFHTKFSRVTFWRESVINGTGQVCCWCGKERPLAVEYMPVVPHGPHQPRVP